MSIWATSVCFDAGDHEAECSKWRPMAPDEPMPAVGAIQGGKRWALDEDATCTCQCGPIRYQASHILPSETDERHGVFGVNFIPSHITRDGRDDRPEDWRPWPWLDLWQSTDAGHTSVVLTRAQVAELHQYLGDWLDDTREPEETAT